MDFTGESTQHNSEFNNTLFTNKFAHVVWQGWILLFLSRIQERNSSSQLKTKFRKS